jgi:hypothetical protein
MKIECSRRSVIAVGALAINVSALPMPGHHDELWFLTVIVGDGFAAVTAAREDDPSTE